MNHRLYRRLYGKGLGKAVTFGVLTAAASVLPHMQSWALDAGTLPGGGTVVGGSASFDYSVPNELHVEQTSDRAIINWDSFNIGSGALTQFHQPSASSLVVNRVTGSQDPTQILGTLKANGKVIVLDKNGVIFGAGSVIDVGSIVASTGDVDNASVMNGNGVLQLQDVGTGGAIVNNGRVTVAEAGLAAFVAPTVINNGVINAKMGKVALASGTSATVDLYGDGLVEVAVDKPLEAAMIRNTGTIAAEGGNILMTASVAKGIIDNVINTSGIVTVASATMDGGKIVLEGANAEVSGTLDASGATGGGTILVGGDYQGSGTTKHADHTNITSTAQIKANTTGTDGNGGKVIVWADDSTHMDGKIEAKGGSHSGNGGSVETSGKINLGVSGTVNASAGNNTGKAGEWLLDPQNIEISGAGANSIPGSGGTVNPSGGANPYTVLDSSISAALSSGNNVTIATTNAGLAQAGYINIKNATILKSGGGDSVLTLKADENIAFIGTNAIRSNTGKLGVILWSNAANQVAGGNINISGTTFNTNGGEFFAGSGLDDGHDITDAFGNTAYNGIAGDGRPDYFATNTAYSVGFNFLNSSIVTGAGDVTILGKGGTANDYLIGIRLANGLIETTSGNINLVGQGGNGPSNISQWGVDVETGSTIKSTTTGSINIDGQGGTGNGSGYGVYIKDSSQILTHDGAMNITGKGGSGTGISNHGIYLLSGNVTSDGSSSIILKGQAGDADSNTAGILLSGAVGGAGVTGDQTYITDRFSMTGTAQTSGTIYIKPQTDSATIGLGGGTGTLNLLDTELAAFTAGKLVIGDSVNGTGDITIDSWDLSGKTFATELYGNDITFQDTDATAGVDYAVKLGTGNFMAQAMDNAAVDTGVLTVNASIQKAMAGTSLLDLRADRDIVFSNGNITATNGLLNTVLNADRDADHDGRISMTNSAITTNGGYFVAGGGSGTVWGVDGIQGTADDAASTGADRVAAWGNNSGFNGVTLNNGDINSGAGAVILNGHGWNDAATNYHLGVEASNGSVIESTNGAITITGVGGASVEGNTGINITGSSTRISSQKGAITLTGTGSGTSSTVSQYNHGVSIYGATVESTGTGADASTITLKGTGGAGYYFNHGISLDNAAHITSKTGDIALDGTGGSSGVAGSNTNEGIYVLSGSDILTNGSADILLKGTGAAGASYNDFDTYTAGPLMMIGGANATGDITLNANVVELGLINLQTTGTILVKPRTASTSIGLGGGAGTLNLTDTELSHLTAGTLIIGDSANPAGNMGDMIVDSWDLSGKAHNVELYGNDITFQDTDGTAGVDYAVKLGSGNFMAHAMDNDPSDKAALAVNAAIIKSVSGTSLLDLRSDRSINFMSGNVTATNGMLNVYLNSDRDSDLDGAVYIQSSSIQTNGGNIAISGGTDDGSNGGVLGDGIADGYAYNTTSYGLQVTTSSILDAQGGDILLKGSGTRGIVVNTASTVKTKDAGKIDMIGYGHDAPYAYGINIQDDASIIAEAGAINLKGYAQNGSTGTVGVAIENANALVRTTTGAINIRGEGTGGTDFWLGAGTAGIQSTNGGAINIDADIILGISSPVSTSGTITIKPRTASQNIRLGTSGVGLVLNDSSLASLNAGTLVIGDAVNGTGDIIVDSWDLSGRTHNVELYGNDITLQDTDATAGVDYALKLGTGDFMAHARDNAAVDTGVLSVNASIQKAIAGASLLDLRADQNIVFSAGNITTTNGILNTVLNADRNADQNGRISISNSAITTNGGYFVAGGGSGKVWGVDGIQGTTDDAASTGADKVAAWGNGAGKEGILFGNGDIATLGGNMILNGHAYNDSTGTMEVGIKLQAGSLLETSSGIITLRGTGGNGVQENHGVLLTGSGTEIRSENGAIDIYGTAGANGLAGNNNDYGISLNSGTVIRSTGVGSDAAKITLVGDTAVDGVQNNYGLFMDSSKILSKKGTINITGTGRGTGSTNAGLRLKNSVVIGSDVASSADIILTGTAITGTSTSDITVNGGSSTIGGTTGYTGNITFNMDKMNLADGVVQTGSTITVKPRTASLAIGLGGGAGGLSLSDTALDMFNAGTLVIGDSVNGTGNIDVDSWDLSGKTQNVQVFGKDIDLGGITLGSGDVTFYSKGANGITVSADSLSNSTGNLNLLSAGNIRVNESLENAGTGHINLLAGWDGTSAITTPALFNTDDVDFALAARNVTIGANGDIKSAGTGTAVLIAASGNFLNNSTAAANAIVTSTGRYLVYGTHPDDTAKGGLSAKNLYNQAYDTNLPSSITGGSRFVYTYQPTLTLTADNITTSDPSSAAYSYTASNLRSDDLLADAVSGSGDYTLGGLVGGNTRAIQFGAGTLSSPMGYNIVRANGVMTISSLSPVSPVTLPPAAGNSVLNQTANVSETVMAESAAAIEAGGEIDATVDCLVTDSGSGSCIVH